MKRGSFIFKETWFSVCSAHQKFKDGCTRCNAGWWQNDIMTKISDVVYRKAPRLWRWWVNRK